jgi:hypothetical protein
MVSLSFVEGCWRKKRIVPISGRVEALKGSSKWEKCARQVFAKLWG